MVLLLAVTAVLLPLPAEGQLVASYSYSSFNATNTTDFQLNGNAALLDPVLRVTPSVASQNGSVFLAAAVPLTGTRSFRAHFSFRIWSLLNSGADGIVFVVQTDSRGNTALGSNGGPIGYGGGGPWAAISPSLGVEFDTYYNGWEPSENHVGVDTDGNMTSLVTADPLWDLEDGTLYHAWVDYEASSDRLTVRLSDEDNPMVVPLIDTTVDLAPMLPSGTAYVGFTSGSGSDAARHDLHSFDLQIYDGDLPWVAVPTLGWAALACLLLLLAVVGARLARLV